MLRDNFYGGILDSLHVGTRKSQGMTFYKEQS
jgi:hypothetical protein